MVSQLRLGCTGCGDVGELDRLRHHHRFVARTARRDEPGPRRRGCHVARRARRRGVAGGPPSTTRDPRAAASAEAQGVTKTLHRRDGHPSRRPAAARAARRHRDSAGRHRSAFAAGSAFAEELIGAPARSGRRAAVGARRTLAAPASAGPPGSTVAAIDTATATAACGLTTSAAAGTSTAGRRRPASARAVASSILRGARVGVLGHAREVAPIDPVLADHRVAHASEERVRHFAMATRLDEHVVEPSTNRPPLCSLE